MAEPPAPADPMEEVETFVAKGREQAETRINALNAEAENLWARLAKVEAASARWKAFAKALDAPPAQVLEADNPKPAGDVVPGEPVLSPAAAPEPK